LIILEVKDGGEAEQAKQFLVKQVLCLKPEFLSLILGLLLVPVSITGVPLEVSALLFPEEFPCSSCSLGLEPDWDPGLSGSCLTEAQVTSASCGQEDGIAKDIKAEGPEQLSITFQAGDERKFLAHANWFGESNITVKKAAQSEGI
jgi:hypothetical protein